jgi:hypothetical protein
MTQDVKRPDFTTRTNVDHLYFPAMRRALHLKMVSQCAVLEGFGVFLVLAEKVRPVLWSVSCSCLPPQSLFAYHIEVLLPTEPQNTHEPQMGQKLNIKKDVQFFRVGRIGERTLVIYMSKNGESSKVSFSGRCADCTSYSRTATSVYWSR